MITQLAKLFRISLSKGHTIIPVRDELLHAKSYMNIQKVRYKNKFEVSFEVDEEIMDYCAVKLVLQPILENALNYRNQRAGRFRRDSSREAKKWERISS